MKLAALEEKENHITEAAIKLMLCDASLYWRPQAIHNENNH